MPTTLDSGSARDPESASLLGEDADAIGTQSLDAAQSYGKRATWGKMNRRGKANRLVIDKVQSRRERYQREAECDAAARR